MFSSSVSHTPVIFLACVNSYRSGKRLRHLVHERKGISKLFPTFNHKSRYEAIQKGNLPNRYFFNQLQSNEYQNRVSVMHLVGHADSDHLRLESDNFETPIHLEEFSKLIGMLPNLQAVFLSGCATEGLVDMLIRRDVPAIIVTQTTDKDANASKLARDFYRELADGKTVQEAARQLSRSNPSHFRSHQVEYDLDSDTFNWKGKGGPLKWGVYFLAENAEKMDEPATIRPLIPFAQSRPVKKFKRKLSFLTYASVALLVGVLAVGITMYLQTPQQLSQLLALW